MTNKEACRFIELSAEVKVKVYPFSDYISCVDMYHCGKMVRSFCSDHRMIEEWLEEPEYLLSFLKSSS